MLFVPWSKIREISQIGQLIIEKNIVKIRKTVNKNPKKRRNVANGFIWKFSFFVILAAIASRIFAR